MRVPRLELASALAMHAGARVRGLALPPTLARGCRTTRRAVQTHAATTGPQPERGLTRLNPPGPPSSGARLFCDLDGVLADFEAGCTERTGTSAFGLRGR